MLRACRWVSIFELLDDGKIAAGSLGTTHVITSIHVPPIKRTNVFWSYKVRQHIGSDYLMLAPFATFLDSHIKVIT